MTIGTMTSFLLYVIFVAASLGILSVRPPPFMTPCPPCMTRPLAFIIFLVLWGNLLNLVQERVPRRNPRVRRFLPPTRLVRERAGGAPVQSVNAAPLPAASAYPERWGAHMAWHQSACVYALTPSLPGVHSTWLKPGSVLQLERGPILIN